MNPGWRCAGTFSSRRDCRERSCWARRRRALQPDDLLDALACAAIARRIHAGLAKPFPDPPPVDRYGLPMAIWA